MRTLTQMPLIKESRHRDYVILLEDLEFAMSKEQLKRITDLHNAGYTLEEIMDVEKRDPYEIIIALLQSKRSKRHMRPFGSRRKGRRNSDSKTG